MTILGIETTCDETSVSVVKNGVDVLSFILSSSAPLHQETGGVVPEIASRKQAEFMIPVLQKALKDAGLDFTGKGIDALAVSVSPGLIGSLLVGVETAKALSLAWNKPLVPVNHLKGHAYSAFLNTENITPQFPLVSLVVSGGHSELYFMKKINSIKWLGGTRDDAAGEAFDKIARLLELGYPGGPLIDAVASKLEIINQRPEIKFPRPLIDSKDFDFSFSGLKTNVVSFVNELKKEGAYNKDLVPQIAYEFREAVVDALVKKTITCARLNKVKTICVGGGVSANSRLRERMNEFKSEFTIIFPPIKYCMDNASMIACAAYFDYKPAPLNKVVAIPTVDARKI